MAIRCALVDSNGLGVVTFNPLNDKGYCIELVDWGLTHKNGVAQVVTKPVWASFAPGTGFALSNGDGTFSFVLPLTLQIEIAEAFPLGESLNRWTFFYSFQRTDCKGGITTCTLTLRQPQACQGERPPVSGVPQIAFLSLLSGTTYKVWSALITDTFVEIKQIDAGTDTHNVLAVATAAIHGENRIYFLHNKTAGNPEISAMDYDGLSVADYGNPGGSGIDDACLALTYPDSKTFPTDPPDFMYFWTQRKGWGNRVTAPSNWSTVNFNARTITGFNGPDDDNLLTREANTAFRRDYKLGTVRSSGSTTVIKTLRMDRTGKRCFYVNTGPAALVELDPNAFPNQLSSVPLLVSASVVGLIGVDIAADKAYFFEDTGGSRWITSYDLDGTNRTLIVDIETDVTSGVAPLSEAGVLG